MKHYKKITCFENNQRMSKIIEFRKLVVTYFNSLHRDEHTWMAGGPIETKESVEPRRKINLMLIQISSIIEQSIGRPVHRYYPPPAIGGHSHDVDAIMNIFELHQFKMPPQTVLDHIDRALGVYESNKFPSFVRTVNPFYWFGRFLNFLVEIPFSLLERVGFNSERIEDSLLGRVIKDILYLIMVVASFLTILQLMGWLDDFIHFLSYLTGLDLGQKR